MEVMLGKIQRIEFGKCGYQEAQLGLSITLGGEGWGTNADMPGGWSGKRSEDAAWTEDDRLAALGGIAMYIDKILAESKVKYLSELVGKPVECTFRNGRLVTWRILKEVL